jgi:hypothetical protein
MQGLSITCMISSLAREWPSTSEMYSGPPVLVPPCVYVLISLLTSLFSDILYGILTFLCFDAKAAKDTKGKGKVNPPNSFSYGGAESVTGSNLGVGAKAASAAQGSPLAKKTPTASGAKGGGRTSEQKAPGHPR